MNRRGHGEGSVYRRGDGQWTASIERGRDARGKRVRQTIYARTKAELLVKLRQAQDDAAKGVPAFDQRQTLADYLDWWQRTVLPTAVLATTAENYRQAIRSYIVPTIGNVRLASLTPDHVESMLRELANRGLAPRTQTYARAILRRALATAERYGYILRNVAAIAEGPKQRPAKLDDAPTLSETVAILDALRSDRLYALAVLALTLGLRRGELLALRWEDVDLDDGLITVRGSLVRTPSGMVVHAPKTSASSRELPLLEPCLGALREHRRAQAAERLAAAAWGGPGIVFTTLMGTYLDPRNVLRWWHRATTAAGLGPRRMHAARHAAATNLLGDGVPLEVVSAILGHAGLAITADVYAKVSQDMKRKALQGVSAALNR